MKSMSYLALLGLAGLAGLVGLVGLGGLTGCVNPLPKVSGAVEEHDPDAWALIEASARAHGGTAAYERLRDVAVAYDGTWLNKIWKLQPQLVDRGYRGSSEERLLLSGPGRRWSRSITRGRRVRSGWCGRGDGRT